MLNKNEIFEKSEKLLIHFNKFKKLGKIPDKFKKDKSIAELRINIGLLKVPQIIKDTEYEISKGNSVVIFAYHHEVISAYQEHFKNDSLVITGQTPEKNREVIKNSFQNKKKKILILSYGAGKEGLTLTASHVMHLAEIDWESNVMVQAIDRIHRCGQTEDCLIRIYYIPKTIDEYILGINNEKLKIQDIIL